jgi:L-alanine-DL-glutamate epimerase-like enolase superfamily enzyme
LKITRIKADIIKIPVKNPYVFSHGILKRFSNVLVRIWTDEGIVGIGESSFIPGGGVSEETPESVKPIIDNYLAKAIIDENPFNLELIHKKMDAIIPRNLIAKSGIDLSLWDIMGKFLNMPVYKLLGGIYESQIIASYTLSIDTPEKMAKQAVFRKQQGYLTLVIKIGRDSEYDIERLRQVREAVGPNIKIRLDANEAYRPDQAIRIIRRMEKYNPEFVEEPVKRWDLDGMARVAHAVDTPISSDESNTSLPSVRKIIEKKAASIINVKISKNGGIYRSKKIAALAEAAGIPIIVGGANTYEIGRQASRHFAISTAQAQMGLGSEGCSPASQSKIDDITKKVVKYEDISKMKGYISISSSPGLGIEIDEDKINKYRILS